MLHMSFLDLTHLSANASSSEGSGDAAWSSLMVSSARDTRFDAGEGFSLDSLDNSLLRRRREDDPRDTLLFQVQLYSKLSIL